MLGGARSGKSALAEELALGLGGERVLYVATALASRDPDLQRRVRLHRERRPDGWGTLELGGGDLGQILEAAEHWRVVLLDSLSLWVSARMLEGEGEEGTLERFDRFLEGASALATPLVLVSDEVGLGVVPESDAGRRFRDVLGLVNQRAAAAAEEVRLCVAGIGARIK
ncbi:MAG TPA: bifunctional adenosylcobinamide kinase/adenosylcobinamide-phosphate guanylyltransferase [Rubrobacteraceae bacterium]|nr:bifunctional adenosylcobinamide kinase/adenosylcobinamide-phosphate guanylyltransferase [Rubrobacteraceae bacterium]